MRKYLYLTEPEWVETWVNGGKILLKLASAYKSIERKGVNTPDENINIRLRGTNKKIIDRFARAEGGASLHLNISGGLYQAGRQVAGPVTLHQSSYECLILCFSNDLDKTIAQRFDKKACVEILDVESLLQALNVQLKVIGQRQECQYTETDDRGVFLKSVDDKWQKEYRLTWPLTKEVEVLVPPGTGQAVTF